MPILDLVFLALGALFLAGGLALARKGEREADFGYCFGSVARSE